MADVLLTFYYGWFSFKLEPDDKIQDGGETANDQTVATLYFLKTYCFIELKKT